MRKKTLALSGVVCLSLSAVAFAAEGPPAPPRVLQVIREEVKPGKGAAHVRAEAGWPRAFAKANWPTHYLALTSMTGPSEAWFLVGFDSFAALEKDAKATEGDKALSAELERLSEKDGELISGSRSLIEILREDLSRNPNVDISQVRYVRVLTFRVRPGHEADFTASAKLVKEAYDKAASPVAWATYQVSAGMPTPSYIVWVPMRSLAESDAALAAQKALLDAEGDEGQKALAKSASDGYAFVEANLFEVNPKMSYPPKAFAARDPAFWAPKPETPPAKKPARKEEGKPAEKK